MTTDKVLSERGEIFARSACVVTMVDRLVHKAEILKIEAVSYRLEEAKEREAARRAERGAKRAAYGHPSWYAGRVPLDLHQPDRRHSP